MITTLKEVSLGTTDYLVTKNYEVIWGTDLSTNAFSKCQETIKTIDFEDGSNLREIQDYAFGYCKVLETVNIHKCTKLTTLGNYVFTSCYALKRIVFPNSVTTIGKSMFEYAKPEYIEFSELLTVLPSREVSNINSLKTVIFKGNLAAISYSCFWACAGLTQIKLPPNLKTIDDDAFSSCSSLASITLPDGLQTIGQDAFSQCISLTEINFPSTITTMRINAFMSCYSLNNIVFAANSQITSLNNGLFTSTIITTVIIPASVTSISDSAFSNTTKLTAYNIEAGSSTYKSVEGVLFTIDDKKLVLCPQGKPGRFTIPSTTETISKSAFQNCKQITEVYIPSSVTSIGSKCFESCENLQTVTFEEGLYELISSTFENCFNLKTVTLPQSMKILGFHCFYNCSSLTTINFPNKLATINNYCFFNCSSLTTVNLPESLKSVGNGVFYNCSSLSTFTYGTKITSFPQEFLMGTKITEIVVKEGITSIKKSCFEDCSLLKTVTLPASLQTLENSVFAGCHKDIKINFAQGSKFAIASKYLLVNADITELFQCLNSLLPSVIIPATIIKISPSVFEEFQELAEVSFDGTPNLEEIGSRAFFKCTKLKTFGICKKLKTILNNAFQETIIENLNFCPNVELINIEAFYNCIKLIELPCLPLLKKMNREAFSGCEKLATINKMDSLTNIGGYCFSSCPIESFPLCPKLNSIDSGAFYRSSLKAFTFPGTMDNIGRQAFDSCESLENITFLPGEGHSVIIEVNAFRGLSNLKNVFIDKNANISKIESYTFPGTGITSFYFPKSLKTIEDGAFAGTKLEKIDSDLDGVLTDIPNGCFSDCENLKEVTLPNSVTHIKTESFNNVGLTSFTVPRDTLTIDDMVFSGCSKMETFIIPDGSNLEHIGYKIFDGCSTLKEIINYSPNFEIFEGALFNKNLSNLYAYPPASPRKVFHMPKDVMYIFPTAFYTCKNLVKVIFGKNNSVVQIDFDTFYGCSNLEMINIPSSLKYIGENAFAQCPKLKCGIDIENPSPEFIKLLVDYGKMIPEAVVPCANIEEDMSPTKRSRRKLHHILVYIVIFVATF